MESERKPSKEYPKSPRFPKSCPVVSGDHVLDDHTLQFLDEDGVQRTYEVPRSHAGECKSPLIQSHDDPLIQDHRESQNWDHKEESQPELNMLSAPEDNFLSSLRLGTTLIVMLGIALLVNCRMTMSMGLVCMVKDVPQYSIVNDSSNFMMSTNFSSSDNDDESNSTTIINQIGPCLNNNYNGSCKQRIIDKQYQNDEPRDSLGSFTWSKVIQGHILSSFFYGFIPGNLIGGWACDRIGGRICLIFSVACSALLSVLIPASAYLHYMALIAIRFMQGFIQGIGMPVAVSHVSHWASKTDVSILACLTYTGWTIGVGSALPINSSLCIYGPLGGWPSVFYLTGFLGLLWCIVAYFYYYDKPEHHPRITQQELKYLEVLGNNSSERMTSTASDKYDINQSRATHEPVPWKKMFTSPVVLTYIFTNISVSFGYMSFAINQPFFMRDVFSLSIDQNGLVSMVPWILELPVNIFLGVLVKWILKVKKISQTTLRKFFTCLGFLLAGAIPIIVAEFPYTWRWIAAFAVSLSEIGNCIAFVAGFLYSPVDFLPMYSATIFSIAQVFTGLNGLITPIIAAYITPNGTREEWRLVFWLAGAVYLIGAVVYTIWGSSYILPWAYEPSDTLQNINNKEDEKIQSLLLLDETQNSEMKPSDNLPSKSTSFLEVLAEKEAKKRRSSDLESEDEAAEMSHLKRMTRREAVSRLSINYEKFPKLEIEPSVLQKLAEKESKKQRKKWGSSLFSKI